MNSFKRRLAKLKQRGYSVVESEAQRRDREALKLLLARRALRGAEPRPYMGPLPDYGPDRFIRLLQRRRDFLASQHSAQQP